MKFFMRDLFVLHDRLSLYSITDRLTDVCANPDAPKAFYDNRARTKLVLRIKDAKFPITSANRPRVLRGLKEAVNWFFDSNKNDLFVYDQNNQLTFNPKYSNLKKVIHKDVTSISEYLEILPSVITSKDYKDYEGVVINYSFNCATALSIDEFCALVDCIEGHSFQEEIVLAYLRSLFKPQPFLSEQIGGVRQIGEAKKSDNPFK